MIKAVRLEVIGDVIGVFYRANTQQKAQRLSVVGWVRNVYDQPDVFGVEGGVEVLAQASEEVLAQFIKELKKGPGVVRAVREEEAVVDSTLKDFEVRY